MAVGYAYSILRDFQLAEDAAQEAFLAAFREIGKIHNPEAFAGWFRRIVFTECHRIIRRRSAKVLPLEEHRDIVDPGPNIGVRLEEKEARVVMMNAVHALAEHERTAILLFYIGGLNLREVSDFLSVPTNTVKSRLHKARLHLRDAMMKPLRESLDELRPSANDEFLEKIRAVLFQAAEGDATALARSLEAHSSLVNGRGPHPYWGGEPQALHVAAEWGRMEAVEVLLKKGANPNGSNDKYDGWSPLHLAIHQDRCPASRDRIIEMLINYGAIVDIWAAAARPDVQRVAEILQLAPEMAGAQGPNRATPLHFVASVEVAKLLMDSGADPHAMDRYGKTPVRTVLSYGNRRKGAAIFLLDILNEWDISAACAVGDADRVKKFVNADAPILSRSAANGETPLNVAALHGQLEVVKILLDLGADVNLKAASGCYPLHLAARNGHLEVAATLIDHKADLTARDDHHQGTPLEWAEFQGQSELEGYLRKRQAEV